MSVETYQKQSDGWHSLLGGGVVPFGDSSGSGGGGTGEVKYLAIYHGSNTPQLNFPATNPQVTLNMATGYIKLHERLTSSYSGRLRAAFLNGQNLIFTIDSRTAAGLVPWSDITAGTQDANLTAIRDEVIGLLNTAGHEDQWIAVSFVHEMNIRSVAKGNATSTDTATTYKPAANHFATLFRAPGHPRLKTIHWIAGVGGAAAFLPDKTLFDYGSGDPYKTGTEFNVTTAAGIWQETPNFFRSNGWTTHDIFITETGIKTDDFSSPKNGQTSYTEQQQLDWNDTWEAALRDETLDIKGAVWFENQGTNHDYRPKFPSIEPAWASMAARVFAGNDTGGGGGTEFPPIVSTSATTTSIADPDAGSGNPLTEASGLIVSRKNKANGRIFWSHNDSGGAAKIYAFDEQSPFTILATYTLTGASNGDWEDITQGPGPVAGVNYIYVGDCGSSNAGTREIYRVAEPTVNPNQTPVTANIACDTFTFTPPTDNCEAIAMDPVTGDMFWFEKTTETGRPFNARVFRCPAAQFVAGGGPLTWTQVSTIRANTAASNNGGITGADISPDGSYIAICNYNEVWVWNRDITTQTVEQVLDANLIGPVYSPMGTTWGAEAIAFDTPTRPTRLYTITEGTGSSLKYATINY